MRFTKLFTVSMDIENPTNFMYDEVKHAMIQLRNEYEQRCYQGCFIVHILEIIKISDCIIITTNLDGNGKITVKFKADVCVYRIRDILTDVTIQKLEKFIFGSHEIENIQNVQNIQKEQKEQKGQNVIVTLSRSELAKTLRIGQKISVVVHRVLYKPFKPTVAIAASVLTRESIAPVFQVQGTISRDDINTLFKYVIKINEELEKRETLIVDGYKEGLWFFEELLYGSTSDFKKDDETIQSEGYINWQGPSSKKTVDGTLNILNIINNIQTSGEDYDMTGYWTRDIALFRSSPLINKLEKSELPIQVPPIVLIDIYLNNILNSLQATREMVGIYNTDELLKSHKNLWVAMQ